MRNNLTRSNTCFHVFTRAATSIVARVQPQTTKGITDLLLLALLQFHNCQSVVEYQYIRECIDITQTSRSRSLSELTRQIAPRTKNGHAPLCTISRSSITTTILLVSRLSKLSRVESN